MIDLPDSAFPLLSVLREPPSVHGLDLAQWDLLIRQARRTKLLGRIAASALEADGGASVPEPVAGVLRAALNEAGDNQRMIRWEINRIGRALAQVDAPVILLKGAAYVAANLPPAMGRLAGDVDIMVPFAKLAEVESALAAHGWRTVKFADYDQRYYRNWMHELPPLRHAERETVIDVHHTILPRTSRLKPDPDRLWRDARDLDSVAMKTFAPRDMLLHSAAHLFHDGDLGVAIRDLVDIVALARHFGRDPVFWDGLVGRARDLHLQRPLFYAMRYGGELLGLEVPEAVTRDLAKARPPAFIVKAMDRAMPTVLLPGHPDRSNRGRDHAALMLYLRAHWLRMPPWLLGWHLARKGAMRLAMDAALWRESRKELAGQRQ